MTDEIPEKEKSAFERKVSEENVTGGRTLKLQDGDGIGWVAQDPDHEGVEKRSGSFEEDGVPTVEERSGSAIAGSENIYVWSGEPDKVVGGFTPPTDQNQGITYDGSSYWTTWNTPGNVYELDDDGNTLSHFSVVPSHPNGVAWDGNNLNIAWNSYIYQHDRSGTQRNIVNLPQGGNAQGIVWDGQNHWSLNSAPNYMYQYDQSWNLIGGFDFGYDGRLAGWDGKHLLISRDQRPNYMYKVTKDGTVVGGWQGIGHGNSGIGWDGKHILTGVDGGGQYIYRWGSEYDYVGGVLK